MKRFFQALLIVSTILFSWLAMMVVHELGHVLHAWMSGGTVAKVVLHPLDFSRTELASNPHPLFVAWGGAIWGSVIPLLLLLLARRLRCTWWYVGAFFAGFCLIANGAYIGAGSLMGAGDAGDLLRQGAPRWLLIVFGVPAFASGLWLWHGLGPHFGLGVSEGQVDWRAAVGVTVVLLVLILAELLIAG
jgi:hypothetical protein